MIQSGRTIGVNLEKEMQKAFQMCIRDRQKILQIVRRGLRRRGLDVSAHLRGLSAKQAQLLLLGQLQNFKFRFYGLYPQLHAGVFKSLLNGLAGSNCFSYHF